MVLIQYFQLLFVPSFTSVGLSILEFHLGWDEIRLERDDFRPRIPDETTHVNDIT